MTGLPVSLRRKPCATLKDKELHVKERSPLLRYGVALAGAAVAVAVRFLLNPLLGDRIVFVTLFPAIFLVGWFGGLGPALLSVVLGALSLGYFILPPTSSFHVISSFAIFFLVGSCTAVLSNSYRKAHRRARLAEDAEREQRMRFEVTLRSIGDGVIATDREGRISFLNPVAEALTGWTTAAAAGKPLDEVFHIVNEQTGEAVENPVTKVIREGTVVGLANHTELISKTGHGLPIDDSGAPIRDDTGRIIGAVLVFRDVSETRRALQEQLSAASAAAHLAAIIESSEDAIISKNLDGIIESWNAAAMRIYGYTAEEMIGRPMTVLLPSDRIHEESDILERIRRGQRVEHFETVRIRKDGGHFDVSLTVSPIRDVSGRIGGASHIARDITERKALDEQLRETAKLESLGVLAGGIAHDFNNLLVGVIGNTSLALEDLPTRHPARPLIEEALLASERAAQLTRQMLAYSGKGQFILDRIDLSEFIRKTLPLLKASIPRTISVELDLAEGLALVEIDVAQVQQLVMNLVINAAEAIPSGRPGIVAVQTRAQDVDASYARSVGPGQQLSTGKYVCLEVRDSGIGMSQEIKARIFDPFFTTKFAGRGLGLAAVLGIVRGHKGLIRVESVPDKGSTFTVLLPALKLTTDDGAGEPGLPGTENLSGQGTVLVIDDEPVVRRAAQHTLERYWVSSASG